ncbi:hypothetical protein M1N05_02290 [Dehalococcoidales bacterium]|nr:hypothetical protein [Dehalococcoidales bacterium]
MESDEWWRSPNGTGPFKLKKWEERSLLVLDELFMASWLMRWAKLMLAGLA